MTSENAGRFSGRTTSEITFGDRLDHFLARWGFHRAEHRVKPGLYTIGEPTAESPIFVSANYTLSFDALRSNLAGIDGYILVLNTNGVNVWCAAGKGIFGTDELVRQVNEAGLKKIVNHRKLIVPQLSAPGMAAHLVKKRTGFKVEYGPVLASDLPKYLETYEATPEMRRVRFPILDRIVLIPVELAHVIVPALVAAVVLYFVHGPMLSMGALASIIAGAILFPLLLPWLPCKDFAAKGFVLGGAIAIPFVVAALLDNPSASIWSRAGWALVYALAMPSVTAFLSLNFTGSSTFTSTSGVRREIFTYIPSMAYMFGAGVLIMISFTVMRVIGI